MPDPRSTAGVVALGPLNPVVDRLGRPVHDLRISVMDRCNFRCPYCMPQSTFDEKYRFLRAQERLSFEEIVRLARVAARLGVRKVRLTGGEPLLRNGLPDLVAELSGIEGIEDLALTTNGVLLAQHAAELKGNGLHRVTVSLDSLDEAVFTKMSGGFGGLPQVLEGIEAALAAGLRPVKVNTVVQRGAQRPHGARPARAFPRHGRHRAADRIHGRRQPQRTGSPRRSCRRPTSCGRSQARWPVTAAAGRYRGEVASRYTYDDGAGEIGFVSSVSEPFCGDCNRARLSSEGVLYTCLFATRGTRPARAIARRRVAMPNCCELLRGAWAQRADRYSELRSELRGSEAPLRKVEMHYIGG